MQLLHKDYLLSLLLLRFCAWSWNAVSCDKWIDEFFFLLRRIECLDWSACVQRFSDACKPIPNLLDAHSQSQSLSWLKMRECSRTGWSNHRQNTHSQHSQHSWLLLFAQSQSTGHAVPNRIVIIISRQKWLHEIRKHTITNGCFGCYAVNFSLCICM